MNPDSIMKWIVVGLFVVMAVVPAVRMLNFLLVEIRDSWRKDD